jgi:hypothetical protein
MHNETKVNTNKTGSTSVHEKNLIVPTTSVVEQISLTEQEIALLEAFRVMDDRPRGDMVRAMHAMARAFPRQRRFGVIAGGAA